MKSMAAIILALSLAMSVAGCSLPVKVSVKEAGYAASEYTLARLSSTEDSSLEEVHEADHVEASESEEAGQKGAGEQAEKEEDYVLHYPHTLTAEGEDYAVKAVIGEDAQLPEDVELQVTPIDPKSERYQARMQEAQEKLDEEAGEHVEPNLTLFQLYDIAFVSDGDAYEPAAPVRVSLRFKAAEELADPENANVIHFDEAQGAEMIENPTVNADEDGTVTAEFASERFSEYAVFYTVDFHWDVNGETFDYSIPGGGFVSFYKLIEALGIEENDTNTEEDEIQELVNGVERITFSDPKLVSVSKVKEDTAVGAIKERLGLECTYSAELTEAQIEEMNAQEAKAGDWALISLKPFDTVESLTVTMKNGEVFTVQITDAQLQTLYLSDNGDQYAVTVTYDDDAQIPENAQLKVTPYDEDSEEHTSIRDIVAEQSEDALAERLQTLDISIVDADGNTIEPKAAVQVKLVIKSMAEELESVGDTLSVIHLDASSGNIQAEKVADVSNMNNIQLDDETATATFTLSSFSQFAITYSITSGYGWNQTTTNYVKVNVHYVDVNGAELTGTTQGETVNTNGTLTLANYSNRMNQTGYTYLGAHYGTYSGQVITSLKATDSPTADSLKDSGYSMTFYNGTDIVARQEYESSLRQVDVYLVYAPSSEYYILDTIGEDGCLTVKNGTEAVQTGIEQNLFVQWYRSSNGTTDFQEVTQSKILNGNYNIPVLGGPKVNVSIDEGADQYYKAEIYTVENNQKVILATTKVYHVPYYDDVRNGGFETPHNNGTTDESLHVHRWPSNWQVENGKNGVIWKTTGLGSSDKLYQDIEIPQGAAADGTGANNLGETLRNYCFAFMPEGNQCAELNCEASGALYQDVLTIPGSQIYWSLYHRARGGYDKWKSNPDKTQNKETDTMYVVAMSKELAEKYDVTTQEKVLSVLAHVNDPDSEFHDVEIVRITTTNQGDGTMEFLSSGYNMTVPPTWFGNLANGQTATAYDGNTKLTYGNTDWHYYTGNFSIPENQYLTRFFFVAGDTASKNSTMGNFLDDIRLTDSVPTPNHGQATAIIQKTVEGLDTLPETYATRIEATYEVTSHDGITKKTEKNSDYDLYRTQIDETGKSVSTASYTFPITIASGGSAVFTNGKEVSPQAEGKTDQISGYEQITTWSIGKMNGETETIIASGTGKDIPAAELAQLTITERDVVCIEFINSYRKKQPVSVWKTDMNSQTITSGAVFDLYKAEEFDDSNHKPKDGAGKVATGTTGTDGILYLGELAQGEYRLLETQAPDGYLLPDAAVKITVTEQGVIALQGDSRLVIAEEGDEAWVAGQAKDTHQIRVENHPSYTLPSAGGPGTYLFTIIGVAMGATAVLLLLGDRRKALWRKSESDA
jgi:hypothetical protein